MKIKVTMSETVFYSFEFEAPDNTNEDDIHELAEDYFINNGGPKPEWFDCCEDRAVEEYTITPGGNNEAS